MSLPIPALPDGLRLYAIGDIHGRLDLLDQILAKIDTDAKTATGKVQTIFLGDYIDRGLYSQQVINRLLELKKKDPTTLLLMGNHEHVMRELLRHGDLDLLSDWLQFGGRETLLSYGIAPNTIFGNLEEALTLFSENIPTTHREFLEGLAFSVEFGDYFFCHAGVRPGVDLKNQSEQDLVWIRSDFLNHSKPFSKMIVHGHTISPEAEFTGSRINIDTGAYATGRLTALGLEGTRQWLMQTG